MDLYDIAIARKLSGGGGGGGGGDSDFSTAQVTFNGVPAVNLYLANVSGQMPVDAAVPMVQLVEPTVNAITAVLYKGAAIMMTLGAMTAELSGNIQHMGGTIYLITGDCTITIS